MSGMIMVVNHRHVASLWTTPYYIHYLREQIRQVFVISLPFSKATCWTESVQRVQQRQQQITPSVFIAGSQLQGGRAHPEGQTLVQRLITNTSNTGPSHPGLSHHDEVSPVDW